MKKESKNKTKKDEKTHKYNVVNPYRKDVFDIYCLWRSFPIAFFRMKHATIKKDGFEVDELMEKLLRCKNLTAFTQEFKISKETLTEWEHSEAIQKKIDELALQNNVLKFRKDIDRAFTKKILRYPD